jgi:galactokinase
MSRDRAIEAFRNRFGMLPTAVIRSPGRVNLIGEHTDYNDGFVLPMAIDRAIWLAVRPRSDRRVLAYSTDQSEPADFDLDDLRYCGAGWIEYVKGMSKMLMAADLDLVGWEGVLTSDLPIGSGLSSSAALEMAVGYAFSIASGFGFDGLSMARWGQRAENEWVGAKTGIMDQLISANGKSDSALLIDCRSLSIEEIPLPDNIAVLIMDTKTRHDHTESHYNERRQSCEQASGALGVTHLRDLNMAELDARSSILDDECRRRARHVVSENARVLSSARAMQGEDVETFGGLMQESHRSLRDDFEVTNRELDTMARLANAEPGCFGARMTGGGFGGCVVALVERDRALMIASSVATGYEDATGLTPEIFETRACKGTSIV